MTDLFQYPMSYPGWWLDNYYYVTWFLAMLFFAVCWAIFFRYGKFNYGVDFGCLWKTTLMILLTTIAIGVPSAYNTRFSAEHGKDGDSYTLAADRIEFTSRKGDKKMFRYKDLVSIYQEPVTYNPPPKVFIVANVAGMRDSITVTDGKYGLPDADKMLSELSKRSGVTLKRP